MSDKERKALVEVVGCFSAAMVEGLQEALNGTRDEQLKDLIERRVMHAYYAANAALDAPSASDDLTAAYMSGRYDGRKLASAQELSDEAILACLDERAPTRTHHGAAVFEYRLFSLIHFARRVLAAKAQGGSHG